MRNSFGADADARVASSPWRVSIAAFLVASVAACEGQVDPSGLGPSSGRAPGNQLPTGTNTSTGGSAGNSAADPGGARDSGGSGSGAGNTNGAATGTGGAAAGPSTGTGAVNPVAPGGGNGSSAGLPCDVQTLLMNRCQTCHGSTPAVGVPSSLLTYQDLTGASKSDPTKTEAVMAVSRMQNASVPMPPKPGTPATTAEVSVLQTWIAAGYPTGSCGGPTVGGGAPDGGASGGGASDAGSAGGGADAGVVGDPFATPSRCTSMKTWTQGTNGSASMEPGMACINCHSRGGEAPRFAVAGTVYPTAHEPDLCNGANGSNGAQIVITGADGKSVTLTPNAVGNFSSNAAVAMPYQAKVTYMGRERLMIAAQMSGDCNSCHTQTGANMAPGRLLLP